MMMSKKKIIALAMSAVMAVGMIAGCGSTNNSGTDTAQTESTEKVTPTFMYFVAMRTITLTQQTQCTLNLKTNIRTKSTFNL